MTTPKASPVQIFHCPACSSLLYFHNLACTCGQQVAYDPDTQNMVRAEAVCANRARIDCNWTAGETGLCQSCAMTETVPDLDEADNLPLWSRTEAAKRWMLANLARWGWFTSADPGPLPVFRMLSERTVTGAVQIVMGHADGLITINVTEASDAVRSERQESMGELYRTMLGHMRHEMAHFLHLRLMQDPEFAEGFRALFGDERADYGAALQRHYASPGVADDDHITSYATAHPHEDWAESLAHLLHLVDLLDSAVDAGLSLTEGPVPGSDYDAYQETDTDTLLNAAITISIAMNHVNRALDLPDLYPFVLGSGVREKLRFIHRHLREGATA